MTTLLADAEALLPDLVTLRRAIHQEPELGLHNPKTAARIRESLAGLPLDWREGPSTTGLVATLRGGGLSSDVRPGGRNGRTVLLRGDSDALPMQEDTGLPFASTTPGAMHACGHDSHVAMLVGAARILCARRDQLAGTVQFMFQPGEEGHHGARFMIEDGLLDPLPDAAFALHVMPNAPHGLVSGRAGPLLASADKIRVIVKGAGGHASMPHDAIDPVPIACAIVLGIQSLVTRTVSIADPAVVTIGQIQAGSTDNVIPETAMLYGTIRTLSPRTRTGIQQNLRRLAENIAAAHGATASVEFTQGFPVTVCNADAVAFGERTVKTLLGEDAWVTLGSPIMGAEDFAYVLEKVPGAMFFLGASHEGADWRSCCALHSNRMVLDEAVMARGAAVHAALATRFLAEGLAG
jgi:hippurate hydrolase